MLLRRREPGHREVEQLRAAHPGLGADRDDREEGGAGDGRLEVLGQHVGGDLLAAEVPVHQGLVLGLLDDALDQRAAQVLVAAVTGLEQSREGGDLAVGALGHVQRHHLVAERRLGLGEYAVVVGPGLVELGDHHGSRHPDVGALAPEGAGPVVDAFVRRDHEQRAVGGPQARADVAHEVGVPGGVDEVDLGLAMDHGRDGEGDGAAVLALGLVEVADGGAVADGPGSGDGPRGGEQRLHQGGLAGATGPHQHHVADPVRAARPQILSGWSPCASFVGHARTPPNQRPGSEATPLAARSQGVAGSPVHSAGRHAVRTAIRTEYPARLLPDKRTPTAWGR